MLIDIDRLGRIQHSGLTKDRTLIVIIHEKEEVPGCVREWITLPEPGDGPPGTGRLPGPLELYWPSWREIWGIKREWED